MFLLDRRAVNAIVACDGHTDSVKRHVLVYT